MDHSQDQAELSYGQRLLPNVIDLRAKSSPDDVFAQFPNSADLSQPLCDITYSTLARLIDSVAFWLEQILGKSNTSETIAYLGPMDIRYYVVALAATKVGFKTLFPSPRISAQSTQSLFDKTQCRVLVTASETKVDDLLKGNTPRHIVIESLAALLLKKDVAPYPYNKTFEEAQHDPFVVIHTSGSTGLPKPVIMYHGGLATVDAQHSLPALDGYRPQVESFGSRSRNFVGLPPFHMGGILVALAIPLYYDQIVVWPPVGRPISSDMIDNLLDHIPLDTCVAGPSVLEEISRSQNSLERLSKLRYIGFGGGPLAREAGNIISRYTRLSNVIGSSESTLLPTYSNEPENWQYLHYNPAMEGFQFRHVDKDIYEQVLVRHGSTDAYQSTWYTFPDLAEYFTHDLYLKHPSKSNYWLYSGRSDDTIVLSNGEKINPNAMQSALLSHPEVKGALIVGQARFEAIALIELRNENTISVGKREVFDKTFRAYIRKANENAPSYGKLGYDHVLFTKAGKPMLRADKGTVKRSATLEIYTQEIDDFYDHLETTSTLKGSQLNTESHDSLVASLKALIGDVCKFETMEPNDDFFGQGMNSLQAMTITREIKASVGSQNEGAARGVSAKVIYSNPNLSKLASAVQGLLDPSKADLEIAESARLQDMEDMVEEFSTDLPPPALHRIRSVNAGLTLILTGSTGSLGSYMLDVALSTPNIRKVICLNRSVDGEEKQHSSHVSRGLLHDWQDKVLFLQSDLSKPRLGLEDATYKLLASETTLIIHNQYPVDFNMAISSFKPHVRAVRNLVNFSVEAPMRPPIIFTSSIGTLGNWNAKHPGEKVPETPFHDFGIPTPSGYAESKYVAEQILENAARASGVPVAIVRVGQLGGPVVKDVGMWNKQEWLPSIITSSTHLGVLPDSLGAMNDIAWIPVDLAAKSIVELAFSHLETLASFHYYNLTNPHPSSWSTLVPAVQGRLSLKDQDHPVGVVSLKTWVKRLGDSSAGTEDVSANPGIKLLDFYKGLQVGDFTCLETSEAERRSTTLKNMKPVGEEWMELWLRQWGF